MPSPIAGKSTNFRRQSKLNFGLANGSKDGGSKTPIGKKKPANGNILNFFKKVEVEEQLFCDGPKNAPLTAPPALKEEDLYDLDDREDEPSTAKRRKLSHEGNEDAPHTPESEPRREPDGTKSAALEQTQMRAKRPRGRGPFLYNSDSEDDDIESSPAKRAPDDELLAATSLGPNPQEKAETDFVPKLPTEESCSEVLDAPLNQDDIADEEFENLEDIEGLFDDADEFDDGEENRERYFMEEQARLEAEEAGDSTSGGMVDGPQEVEGIVESCPLCNASLAGITPDQATVHVNACLDGHPMPPANPEKPALPETVGAPEVGKRFAKAAVPRPGQANPISLGGTEGQSTSAFSKLMSGHAENAAWATAAASEQSSRGKPAHQRTCPFYKIMPGFSICVDAFRYGAVKGCSAYFLSHFHSDHYVGLTANWSHGPIYCSKVTGSLVKSQLRTAARWVRELEFEETVEIPGTDGATVTMIPANHCPGSSLFLFEKAAGGGTGNSRRKQRILHCGDFRACPAHVTHPLLRPETVDAVSGRARQQKIDVCYLDTTYLDPRYAFPPQDDVIAACAEFCRALSEDPRVADEVLSAAKRGKHRGGGGGASVSKFFPRLEDGGRAQAAGEGSGEATAAAAGGGPRARAQAQDRLLVVCGTYSIGKERLCKAVARALGTRIFAPAAKRRACAQLGDAELAALLTADPRAAQVHLQPLGEVGAAALRAYLDGQRPHFGRVVGFRPSGWSFRGSSSGSSAAAPSTPDILHGAAWRPRFGRRDLAAAAAAAARGAAPDALCLAVPYSEHSSFRELALFLLALRVDRVVPTVNVGSDAARRRMRRWTDRWIAERRRAGVARLLPGLGPDRDGAAEESGDAEARLWDGRDGGAGGGVRW
ncbi:DRMBL-domain-containing protein [Durotheca rogersii]|uniref:DRMBL-domain-containing protein n=1 Tax=Durotheca rogersii TaxID=419775 RepID=UPI0022208A5B|nr:DRMBL-domain-containing protein [Durotheca rogersii]KAI5862107.1 DRMBL-domain-containing protein [Durotheca rogersii]